MTLKPESEWERRQKDLRMMQHPEEWPLLALPLKRSPTYIPEPIAALLTDHGPTIYYVNLYQAKNFDWDNGPQKTYIDYEGILDDGWKVD